MWAATGEAVGTMAGVVAKVEPVVVAKEEPVEGAKEVVATGGVDELVKVMTEVWESKGNVEPRWTCLRKRSAGHFLRVPIRQLSV